MSDDILTEHELKALLNGMNSPLGENDQFLGLSNDQHIADLLSSQNDRLLGLENQMDLLKKLVKGLHEQVSRLERVKFTELGN